MGSVGCDSRQSSRPTPAARPTVHAFLPPSPLQVRDNVDAVLQGLGLVPSPQADAEAAALAEVRQLLAPVQGVTWASGLPENN